MHLCPTNVYLRPSPVQCYFFFLSEKCCFFAYYDKTSVIAGLVVVERVRKPMYYSFQPTFTPTSTCSDQS